MKRQLGKQEIADLLDKFMAGETSLEEENILAQYFRTHEVSDEWKEYKEMFALFDDGAVDIEQEAKPVAKPKIIPFRWIMTGIAASVILLIGISLLTKDSEPVKKQPVVTEVVEQPAPEAPKASDSSEYSEYSDNSEKSEPSEPVKPKRTYKPHKLSKFVEEPLLAEAEVNASHLEEVERGAAEDVHPIHPEMNDPYLAIMEQMKDIRSRGERVRQEVAQLIDKH